VGNIGEVAEAIPVSAERWTLDKDTLRLIAIASLSTTRYMR
jgi:hypothetical protein